jgi:hypothetical protein
VGLDISNPISSIADVAKLVLGRVLPDKEAKDAANAELAKMALSGELAQVSGQLAINQAEATSGNWLSATWRPAIGWCCVLGLFSQMIVRPFALWGCALAHRPDIVYPSLDLSTLMTLIFAMLGIGVHEKLTS